jgi:uncharacterized protein
MKKRAEPGSAKKINFCEGCEAKCCRYFALQIDTPRTKEDFEKIRWYLAHRDVTVFVEKRKWFLDVANECRYLTKEHGCAVYEKRPLVCREHSTYDCERVSDEFDHNVAFGSMEELDKYLKEKKRKRRKK